MRSLTDRLGETGAMVEHWAMRPEVLAFVADGPLPDWDADEDEITRRCDQLEAITKPVTAQEAKALTGRFGPDDCYGVAWTLLHLIETGPNPVLTTRPARDDNEWHRTLYLRAVNAGLIDDPQVHSTAPECWPSPP